MRIQPAFEGAMLGSQVENPLRVDDGRVDLEPVADDARIGQQAGAIRLRVIRYRFEVEVVIGAAEVIRFLEDGDPRQPRLVDLENKALEEQVVVVERKTVLGVVIGLVEGVFRMGEAVFAVGGHLPILLSPCRSAILLVSRCEI